MYSGIPSYQRSIAKFAQRIFAKIYISIVRTRTNNTARWSTRTIIPIIDRYHARVEAYRRIVGGSLSARISANNLSDMCHSVFPDRMSGEA
jgi:hypothetical protein